MIIPDVNEPMLLEVERMLEVPESYSLTNQLLSVIVQNWIKRHSLEEYFNLIESTQELRGMIETNLKTEIVTLKLEIKKANESETKSTIVGEILLKGDKVLTFEFANAQYNLQDTNEN